MPRIDSRLLFLLFSSLIISVIWSCSQPSDIETPVAQTELTLSVERLPEAPPGMIYQLWVVRTAVTSNAISPDDAVSVGRFSFEDTGVRKGFIDESGNPISNVFGLKGDLFSFQSIVISVELAASSPLAPSNIMLLDRITGVVDRPIRMNFPMSEDLWSSIVRYNMEGVSDNNRSSGDGSGVWFSSYRSANDTFPDTIDVNWTFDTIVMTPNVFNGITLNIDTLKALYPYVVRDSVLRRTKLVFERDTLLLGLDSFIHQHMTFTVDSMADSTFPYERRGFTFNYTVPNPLQLVVLDIFTQDDFGLPDVSGYGFHYKGWVVSPVIPTAAGRMTPPGWRFKSQNKNWIPGDDGGILTTGTFSRIDLPDDGNPFTLPLVQEINGVDTTFRHPQYPGEDFLDGAALSLATNGAVTTSVNLMPNAFDNVGTIFITLEPMNMTDTSTNFPLFAFIGSLPQNRSDITNNFTTVQINMLNATQTVPNDLKGFPEIIVAARRF